MNQTGVTSVFSRRRARRKRSFMGVRDNVPPAAYHVRMREGRLVARSSRWGVLLAVATITGGALDWGFQGEPPGGARDGGGGGDGSSGGSSSGTSGTSGTSGASSSSGSSGSTGDGG